jgi:putative restriction endonuclease
MEEVITMNANDIRSHLATKNYVLKADIKTGYWFGLSKLKVNEYRSKNNDDFNIILFGQNTNETDYYIIPYIAIKDLLDEENVGISNGRERWVGNINQHKLTIRKSLIKRNVIDFYSLPFNLSSSVEKFPKGLENDFAIENAKREINIRLKQSVFRRNVLKNFNNRCCVSDCTEVDLLVASHIIPWSSQVKNRLNPGNGLCLSSLYDKLFDSGYFTIDENGVIEITERLNSLSAYTKGILQSISGKKINKPALNPILDEAVLFHKNNIFNKF